MSRHRIPPRAAVLCVLFLTVTIDAAAQDTAGRARFLHWAYQDAATLVGGLGQREALVGLGMGAVLAPTSLLDARITDMVQDREAPNRDRVLSFLNPYGGPRGMRVSAGVFAATLLTRNEKLQDAAFTSFQSVVYSGLVMYTLKSIVGRSRPEALSGPYSFRPFSDSNLSFPSGHTSTAFALVTPWVEYYGGPTVLLYGAAAGVGIARIARDKHWFTDVVAGAALGYLTGRSLSRLHLGDEDASSLTLEPSFSLDGPMLRLSFEF